MSRKVDYSILTERRCGMCGLTKPIAEFSKYESADSPLGWRYYSRCKSCNRVACQAYSRNGKSKRNERLRTWRRSNPAKAAAVDRRKHLGRYGLTEDSYAAMVKAQSGKCLLCLLKKKLNIDHCHQVGTVRGLLCSGCNNGVGWIEKNRDILDRVVLYLELANR